MSVIFFFLLLLAIYCQGSSSNSTCNRRLLDNFRLSGLGGGPGRNSTVCPSISAASNCCSVSDEIKILKSWNTFTQPKLSKFAQDMMGNYQKILSLDVFVKAMNFSDIRYHSDNFVWKKVSESKCFSAKYFVDMTEVNKLITQNTTNVDNLTYYDLRAINMRNQILADIAGKVQSLGLWSGQATKTYLIDPASKNQNIHQILNTTSRNALLRTNAATLNTTLLTMILDIPAGSMSLPNKPVNESIAFYLNYTLNITNTVMTYARLGAQAYELRRLQDFTYSLHIANLQKFLTDNQAIIISSSNPLSSQAANITQNTIENIKQNTALRFQLERFLTSEWVFSPANQDPLNDAEAQIIKELARSLDIGVSIVGLRGYKGVQMALSAFQQIFSLKNTLNIGFKRNTIPFLNDALNSMMTFSLIQTNSYNNTALVQAFNQSLYIPNTYEIADPGFEQPIILSTAGSTLRAAIRNNAISILTQGLNQVGLSITLDPAVYDTNFARVYDRLVNLTSSVNFSSVSTGANNDICAVVTKHNLLKETRFNRQKYTFCKQARDNYTAVNINNIYANLPQMRAELLKILSIKKGFYCAICDQANSNFINTNGANITYSTNFCKDLLTQFRSYLMWKNFFLIDYFNKLFQYLSCFATDGTPKAFPFQFFANDLLQLAPRVSNCTNSSMPDSGTSCSDICSRFNLLSYSPFFDGDRRAINKMYTFVLNTVRMYGFKFVANPIPSTQSRILQTVTQSSNATNASAGSDPTKLPNDFTNRAHLSLLLSNLDKLNVYTRTKPFEWDETQTTYQTYHVTQDNFNFSLFSTSVNANGLNPLALSTVSNFDPKVGQVFVQNDQAPPEILDRNVLRDVVLADKKDQDGFETDAGMKWDSAPSSGVSARKLRRLHREREVKRRKLVKRVEKKTKKDRSILGFLRNLLFS